MNIFKIISNGVALTGIVFLTPIVYADVKETFTPEGICSVTAEEINATIDRDIAKGADAEKMELARQHALDMANREDCEKQVTENLASLVNGDFGGF